MDSTAPTESTQSQVTPKATKKRAPRAQGAAKTGGKSKVQKKNLCLTKPSLKRLLNVALGVQNGTMRISKNAALEADRQFNRDLTKYSGQLFSEMKKNKITQAKRPFMRRVMVNQQFGYLLGSDIQQKSPFFESTK